MAINISDEDFDEIFKRENTSKPRWQPIETAPKGPEILVWDGKDIWLVNTEYNKMYPKENGCGCCSSSVHEEATHWMPLPKPPQMTIETDDRRMRPEDLTGTIKRVKGE